MADASLPKLAGAVMAELVPRLDLTRDGAAAIAGCAGVAEAIAALERAGLLVEATRLFAHALPRREAVWWACMCARHCPPPALLPVEIAALEAAEAWVRAPQETERRAAFERAQEAGFGSTESWAAVAAFWSGDSMAPAGQPAVPPPPHAAGAAVAGAVALASVRAFPERREARLARFLGSAREIAGGGVGRLPPEDGS
jgi:hypothetical protein